MAPKRPATNKQGASLRDVAEYAGVSIRTVSNVVNGYEYVADETRAHVKRALDHLDYRPNLAARTLRTGRSEIVSLAVPLVDQPYFAELAREIVRAARSHGYTVLIEQTESLAQRERSLFTDAASRLIDGVILSPGAISADELVKLHPRVPVVLLGEQISEPIADHVAIDNVEAARVATEHLIALGRRRIAAINCAPDGPTASRMRYEGYTQALAAAGIKLDPGLIAGQLSGGRDRQSGAVAMEQLLAGQPVPDAIFCFNDLTALGAIRALLHRGYRVPHQVAVIGVDDIEDGRFSTPTLSTISPNKARIAESAVELLVSRIRGSASEPREVVADFSLVVRESTGG